MAASTAAPPIVRSLTGQVRFDGGNAGPEHRAPSVWCLAEVLAGEIRAEFGEGARDKTVHDIEPTVIRGKGPEAYVDALAGEDHVGAATHMLSYTWEYRVLGLIIPTLQGFCGDEGLDPKRAYIWMCCLCVDQHRVQERRRQNHVVTFDEFHEIFGTRVSEIGHVLSLMEPWASPACLRRVWCVFELHTALRGGARVTVLMPPEERSSLCGAMLDDARRKTIYQAVASVDIERAESSVPADRQHILQLVRGPDGGGAEELNRQTRQKCKALYIDVLDGEIRRALGGPAWTRGEQAELCSQVSMMLFDDGRPEEAFGLVAAGLGALDPGGPPRTLEGARLLTQRGYLESKRNELKVSRACFDSAKQLLGDLGAAESMHAARVLEGLGGVHRKALRLGDAEAELGEGHRVHELLGTLDTMKALTLIYNLGVVKSMQGDLDSAKRHFDRVKGIRVREGTLNTPGGSLLLEAIARLQERQGKLGEAIATCEEALHSRTVSDTLRTLSGAKVYAYIGSLRAREGQRDGALGAYADAKDILLAIHETGSDLGKEVSEALRSLGEELYGDPFGFRV